MGGGDRGLDCREGETKGGERKGRRREERIENVWRKGGRELRKETGNNGWMETKRGREEPHTCLYM